MEKKSSIPKKLISFLLQHELIVFVVCAAIFLRIPSLFEPYWYGDEGIYLTIGTAMRQGDILYTQTIDHKTPLIYVLAALAPSQFWFKFLFIAWNVGMICILYAVLLRLRISKKAAAFTSTVFLLLTALPAFEGNIVNGELLVMGWMLAGLFAISHTSFFVEAITQKVQPKSATQKHRDIILTFIAGCLFSFGVLTKVPGGFDIAGVGFVLVLLFFQHPSKQQLLRFIKTGIMFVLGFFTPIMLSVFIFWILGAAHEYYQFGLLYNFRYSGAYAFDIANPILSFFFSTPGKALFVVIFCCLAVFLKKIKITSRWFFVWFLFSLFASLLSSRPYPHYLQQVFLPLALLLGTTLQSKKATSIGMMCVAAGIFLVVVFTGKFGIYPTVSYYKNFFSYITGQTKKEEYRNAFNPLMKDTYEIASYIQSTTQPNDRIFIWGTNPMLYALARRAPAGRFTVSFHIKDFQAYDETIRDIERRKPPVIIYMNDEDMQFDALDSFVKNHYAFVKRYPTMVLYRYVN